MKCANCPNDAKFLDSNPSVNPVAYCESCLPKDLIQAAVHGKLPLPEEPKNERSKNSSKAGASSSEDSVSSKGSVPSEPV